MAVSQASAINDIARHCRDQGQRPGSRQSGRQRTELIRLSHPCVMPSSLPFRACARLRKLFINLDNAVTVTRNENDVAERGNRDQVYILVNEQPEETVALIPR